MDWSTVTFKDGTCLTEGRYSKLLHGAKLYLVLASEGKASRRPLRGTVLKTEWHRLTQLIRWMAGRGLTSFRELSMAHITGYRNYVARRTMKKANNKSKRQTRGSNTQYKLLKVVKRLVRLQMEMSRWGTELTAPEIGDLAGYLRAPKDDGGSTDIIPDQIFRQTMDSAIEWLTNQAQKVLIVEATFDAYRKKRMLPGQSTRSRERYDEIAKELLADDEIVLNGVRKTLRSLTYFDVGRLVTITRGACFVVIAGGVGMRESEIGSLQVGCMRSASFGNGPPIVELEGTLYKTSKIAEGEAATWHAGFDDNRNPVRLAVETLEALPRPDFGTSLFGRMFDTGTRLRENNRLSKAGVKKALRAFASQAGLSSDWNFAPHQFRKAFARFVALSGVSAIFALMRHFKHQSVLMTERYLPRLKADPELLNEVFEARESLVSERLDKIFGAERLGGLAGQRIVANNKAYRGEKNAVARAKLVAMTLRDPTAYYRLAPQGLCLYESAFAKCGGKAENVGLFDSCIGCYNFATGEDNLDSWLDIELLLLRRIREQEELGFVNLGLHQQLDKARNVIAEIMGSARGQSA